MHRAEFSSINAADLDLVGTVLDSRYRIDSVLGCGAMGTVFSARHLKLERTVALKLLNRSLLGLPKVRQRFMQEAQAASRLCHPNVVKVYASGVIDGRAFIEMELLKGESLAELLLREKKLPLDQAISIISDAARGLANAHESGVIHRDIKPSNVMLIENPDGKVSVKVVDLGVAKILEPDGASVQSLTATNGSVGTPLYMSPEQCSSQELDARSDIYSLGCVLYELLSGQTAVLADSPFGAMLAHIQGDIQPLPPMHPEWIISVVDKALRTERAERFQSMEEFIAALSLREIVFYGNAGDGPSPKISSLRGSSRLWVLVFSVACTILLLGFLVNASRPMKQATDSGRLSSLKREIDQLKMKLPRSSLEEQTPEVVDVKHQIALLQSEVLKQTRADRRFQGHVDETYRLFLEVLDGDHLRKDQKCDVLMEMAAIPGLNPIVAGKTLVLVMTRSNELAFAFMESGDSEQCFSNLERSRKACDLLAQQKDPREFRSMFPQIRALGECYASIGQHKNAELAFTVLEKGVGAQFPNSARQAQARYYLAHSKRLQGQVAEAEKMEATAVAIVEAFAKDKGPSQELAEVFGIIGEFQTKAGQPADAVRSCQRSLAMFEKCGAGPAVISGARLSLAWAWLLDLRHIDRAEEESIKASKDFGDARHGNKLRFSRLSKDIGDRYTEQPNGSLENAQKCYLRAIAVFPVPRSPAERVAVFWGHVGMAHASKQSNRSTNALRILDSSCLRANIPNSIRVEAYKLRGEVLAEQKNYQDALEAFQTELKLRIKVKAAPSAVSLAALQVAQSYRGMGNQFECDKYLQLAREYARDDQTQTCLERIDRSTK